VRGAERANWVNSWNARYVSDKVQAQYSCCCTFGCDSTSDAIFAIWYRYRRGGNLCVGGLNPLCGKNGAGLITIRILAWQKLVQVESNDDRANVNEHGVDRGALCSRIQARSLCTTRNARL
jgi:hypothetical protein